MKSLDLPRGFSGIAIGAIAAIGGMIWLIYTTVFVMQASKASGVILGMESSRSGNTQVYFPVFSFTDSGGIVHTQRTTVGASDYAFWPGQQVTVLYKPTAPDHSEIASFETIWSAPVYLTALGLGFAVLSYFCVYVFPPRTSAPKK